MDTTSAKAILRGAVRDVVPPTDLGGRVARGIVRARRRRAVVRTSVATVAVAVLFGATLAAVTSPAGDEGTEVVANEGGSETSSPTTERPPGANGDGWRDLDRPPLVARAGAVVVIDSKQMLVWGGRRETGGLADDGAILDLVTGRWRILDIADEHQRYGAAGAVVGGVVYIIGGSDDIAGESRPPGVLTLDLASGSTEEVPGSASQPSPGLFPVVATDGRVIEVAGGRQGELGERSTAVVRFDPSTGGWTDRPPAPWPLAAADAGDPSPVVLGAAGPDGTIVAARVIGSSSSAVEVSQLDGASAEWSAPTTTPLGRSEYAAGGLFIVARPAGFDVGTTRGTQTDVLRFAATGAATGSYAVPPNACEGPTASVATEDEVFLFGPCGEVSRVDPRGAVKPFTTAIEGEGVTLLVAGSDERIVVVDLGYPEGGNAPPRPGKTLVLS